MGTKKARNKNCAFLGYYAGSRGNFLPTIRDKLWDGEVVPKRQQEITTTRCVTTQKSSVLIYFTRKPEITQTGIKQSQYIDCECQDCMWRSEGIAPLFFKLGTSWRRESASGHHRFIPRGYFRRVLHRILYLYLTVHHQLGKVIQMNQLDTTMIY